MINIYDVLENVDNTYGTQDTIKNFYLQNAKNISQYKLKNNKIILIGEHHKKKYTDCKPNNKYKIISVDKFICQLSKDNYKVILEIPEQQDALNIQYDCYNINKIIKNVDHKNIIKSDNRHILCKSIGRIYIDSEEIEKTDIRLFIKCTTDIMNTYYERILKKSKNSKILFYLLTEIGDIYKFINKNFNNLMTEYSIYFLGDIKDNNTYKQNMISSIKDFFAAIYDLRLLYKYILPSKDNLVILLGYKHYDRINNILHKSKCERICKSYTNNTSDCILVTCKLQKNSSIRKLL